MGGHCHPMPAHAAGPGWREARERERERVRMREGGEEGSGKDALFHWNRVCCSVYIRKSVCYEPPNDLCHHFHVILSSTTVRQWSVPVSSVTQFPVSFAIIASLTLIYL